MIAIARTFVIALALLPAVAFAQASTAPSVRSIRDRIDSREFPSVFQAWNKADNLKDEDQWTTLARHDLVFHDARFFHLRWNNTKTGLADGFVPESVPGAVALRQTLLKKNPNLITLAEIRYRDADKSYLPEDSPWWKRKDGQIVKGWEEGGFWQLDFANPEFRKQVAAQAHAVMAAGVFDGIMLDWWSDDDDRLALIKAVRDAVGDDAVILVNANDRQTPVTAKYVNGYFMECWRSATAEDWKRIADTLTFAEKNLRQPHLNCMETWYHQSRQDLNLMRATTTLSLTMSDGYCLFSDPNPLPTPDHLHDWYDFWNKSLGHAKAAGAVREDKALQREFDEGFAVYNPMGNGEITVKFDKPHRRASNAEIGKEFKLADCDGDLFLNVRTAAAPTTQR